MNDHPSNLTNYDTFSGEMNAKLIKLRTEVKAKLYEERVTVTKGLDLPGWVPFIGNDNDYGDDQAADVEGVIDHMWRYCRNKLAAEYDSLDKIATSLTTAKLILNGMKAPNGLPGSADVPSGVDSGIRSMTEGLVSWKNSTAEAFKVKYVTPIASVKTNHVQSIDRSLTGINAAKSILVESRRSAGQLVDATISALQKYHPIRDDALGTANAVLNTIGIFADPGVATAIVVITSKLPQETGKSVAGLMKALKKAIDTNETDKSKSEKAVAAVMDKHSYEEWGKWKDYVCARPSP